MKRDEKYHGIIRHPYIERQGKQFILAKNATILDVNAFIIIMDMAESMCTCSSEDFEIFLPVFKAYYLLVGDADKEINFIREQRKD